MSEKFRRTRRGEIRSSEGFSVRIIGTTGLEHKQGRDVWRLDSEAMTGPGIHVVLYSDRIPDDPRLDRTTVADNIARAFASANWRLDIVP